MDDYKIDTIKRKERTTDSYIYLVRPSAKLIQQYLQNRIVFYPFTTHYIFLSKYNFTVEDFYKYLISKFHATVEAIPQFPFFKFYFTDIKDAQAFVEELKKIQ